MKWNNKIGDDVFNSPLLVKQVSDVLVANPKSSYYTDLYRQLHMKGYLTLNQKKSIEKAYAKLTPKKKKSEKPKSKKRGISHVKRPPTIDA